MVSKARRKHSAAFKAKVALEAVQGTKTMAELARKYSIHASQIQKWKSQLLTNVTGIFESGPSGSASEDEQLVAMLYQQIGKLQVELDWLKKKSECLF